MNHSDTIIIMLTVMHIIAAIGGSIVTIIGMVTVTRWAWRRVASKPEPVTPAADLGDIQPKDWSLHSLFDKCRRHPDYIGGTIFTVYDLTEGSMYYSGAGCYQHERELTEHLTVQGNEFINLKSI